MGEIKTIIQDLKEFTKEIESWKYQGEMPENNKYILVKNQWRRNIFYGEEDHERYLDYCDYTEMLLEKIYTFYKYAQKFKPQIQILEEKNKKLLAMITKKGYLNIGKPVRK